MNKSRARAFTKNSTRWSPTKTLLWNCGRKRVTIYDLDLKCRNLPFQNGRYATFQDFHMFMYMLSVLRYIDEALNLLSLKAHIMDVKEKPKASEEKQLSCRGITSSPQAQFLLLVSLIAKISCRVCGNGFPLATLARHKPIWVAIPELSLSDLLHCAIMFIWIHAIVFIRIHAIMFIRE